ncbi:14919_t:CDS:2 [Entrophospora sp. SA101]|nr:14919_t:CDS:2 [Entrophospora sp. SA101]
MTIHTKRKRKYVTFAPEHLLIEIKYIENHKDYYRIEESEELWYIPPLLIINKGDAAVTITTTKVLIKKSKAIKSQEAELQYEREKQLLETIYLEYNQIPESPQEPLSSALASPPLEKPKKILLFNEEYILNIIKRLK